MSDVVSRSMNRIVANPDIAVFDLGRAREADHYRMVHMVVNRSLARHHQSGVPEHIVYGKGDPTFRHYSPVHDLT